MPQPRRGPVAAGPDLLRAGSLVRLDWALQLLFVRVWETLTEVSHQVP